MLEGVPLISGEALDCHVVITRERLSALQRLFRGDHVQVARVLWILSDCRPQGYAAWLALVPANLVADAVLAVISRKKALTRADLVGRRWLISQAPIRVRHDEEYGLR